MVKMVDLDIQNEVLEMVVKRAKNIYEIDERVVLSKFLEPIVKHEEYLIDVKKDDDFRDWLYLNYHLREQNITTSDHFIAVLLSKVKREDGQEALIPWYKDTLLHILTQAIHRKNAFKKIIGKEPKIIFNGKQIDFNNLVGFGFDLGYDTDESYKDEEEVLGLAKHKGISYKEDNYIPGGSYRGEIENLLLKNNILAIN